MERDRLGRQGEETGVGEWMALATSTLGWEH